MSRSSARFSRSAGVRASRVTFAEKGTDQVPASALVNVYVTSIDEEASIAFEAA